MTDENVLLQADALMRRHRSFVAQAPEHSTAGPLLNLADDNDIPLLTEIVTAPDELAPPSIEAVLEELHREIEQTISHWLIDTLPAAIANASQHILTEVDAKARLTLLPQVQALIDARRDNEQ
ncbi:hypothetical protein MASR1M60_05790 [Rhodocyclaceae bacterium]